MSDYKVLEKRAKVKKVLLINNPLVGSSPLLPLRKRGHITEASVEGVRSTELCLSLKAISPSATRDGITPDFPG